MDKQLLVDQLVARLRETIATAEREMAAAADAAQNGEEAKARREDTRMAIEYSALARGQQRRAEQARIALSELESFHPRPIPRGGRVQLGAIIEVEDEDTGDGRTLFLAPHGAGVELTGPGGDGFFSVVTPGSPLGRAAQGLQVGDSVDVTVDGVTRSWAITWLE